MHELMEMLAPRGVIEQEAPADWESLASTFGERKQHTWQLFIDEPRLARAVRKEA